MQPEPGRWSGHGLSAKPPRGPNPGTGGGLPTSKVGQAAGRRRPLGSTPRGPFSSHVIHKMCITRSVKRSAIRSDHFSISVTRPIRVLRTHLDFESIFTPSPASSGRRAELTRARGVPPPSNRRAAAIAPHVIQNCRLAPSVFSQVPCPPLFIFWIPSAPLTIRTASQ